MTGQYRRAASVPARIAAVARTTAAWPVVSEPQWHESSRSCALAAHSLVCQPGVTAPWPIAANKPGRTPWKAPSLLASWV